MIRLKIPANERHLAKRLARRDEARAALLARARRFKDECATVQIKARVTSNITSRANDAAVQTVGLAKDSGGVLVGTCAVLGLWLARRHVKKGVWALWQMWRNRT